MRPIVVDCQTAADVRRLAREVARRRRQRDLAARQLPQPLPEPQPPLRPPGPPTPRALMLRVIAAVCEQFKVEQHSLLDSIPHRWAAHPRYISMVLCRAISPATTGSAIARLHRRKDHAVLTRALHEFRWLRQLLEEELTPRDPVEVWVARARFHYDERFGRDDDGSHPHH